MSIPASMSLRAGGKKDLGWCICLAFGTIVYLRLWPRDLNWYDEGVLLSEAKRILEGDVPYRDFFEVVTPGAWYVMAVVFRLFGTTIETARATMSVVHALSVVVIYLCGRALRLSRGYAALPAVAYIAICYPNCAYATPHWFATFFALVLLLGLLIAPTARPRQERWLFGLGMLASVLLVFQQQRGLAVTAGIPLIIVIDHLFAHRAGEVRPRLTRALAAYVAGGLVVALPLLVFLLAVPGLGTAYHALVQFPLAHYPSFNRVAWGHYVQFPSLVLPWLFQYLPILLPAGVAAVLADVLRGASWRAVRRRIIVLLFCVIVIPSILHYPDYLRISLIAPFFFILATDLLDWVVGQVGARISQWIRLAVAAGLMMGLAYLASHNLIEKRKTFPVTHSTAFGEVSFSQLQRRALFIDRVRQALDAAGSKEIFAYPYYPGIYLLTGAKNATRYSLLISGYSPPQHFQEVIATLEAKRTPFVAFGLSEVPEPTEFTVYLESHYREVPLPGQTVYHLFQRKEV